MVSKEMNERLLQRQLSYIPRPQPYYTFDDITYEWVASSDSIIPDASNSQLSSLVVICWNIDFMAPEPSARMESALNYLERLVFTIPSSSAVVILLQEMMEESYTRSPDSAKDLTQIAQAHWVQSRFNITDLDGTKWGANYGQVTLIDRRLTINQVSRLHLVSEFQRDALLVDIRLSPLELDDQQYARTLRLCNVHLDSMVGPLRPIQWEGVAKHLQNLSVNIEASILAGDCNANSPRDWTEPHDNEFIDSYLELGGVESDEEGCTWGFQSQNWERYGRGRLDKQVYWGGVKVVKLERIGVGVEVEDVLARRALLREGSLTFVTDHYGLMGLYDLEVNFEVRIDEKNREQEKTETDIQQEIVDKEARSV